MDFQRLTGVDWSVGADRRETSAGGVEVGFDACNPVFLAVARRRGPAPEALAFRLVVELLKLLVKCDVQPVHPQLVLLFLSPLVEISFDRKNYVHSVECPSEHTKHNTHSQK